MTKYSLYKRLVKTSRNVFQYEKQLKPAYLALLHKSAANPVKYDIRGILYSFLSENGHETSLQVTSLLKLFRLHLPANSYHTLSFLPACNLFEIVRLFLTVTLFTVHFCVKLCKQFTGRRITFCGNITIHNISCLLHGSFRLRIVPGLLHFKRQTSFHDGFA